jgi:poly-gamma-glutamate capsule biosynthesis protein CapA/YwtB (metallophosphatase superfamily)
MTDVRGLVTLLLCGDVMTGRGVDQILPHAGDPTLWETHVRDARTYVALAEEVNGPIPRPVDFSWPWGDALPLIEQMAPDVRLINLETSITRGGEVARGKAVHYRMTPENVGCLTIARPSACALANNHVLDFGGQGLRDTMHTLAQAGIATAGAGIDATEARQPVVVNLKGGNRMVVCSTGTQSSGIPPAWAATRDRPGVYLLSEVSIATADEVAELVWQRKRPGDLAAVSIHWGSNWGYDVPVEHVRFAHRLIDRGVDLVHGHSSHHPRPVQVYRGKLILYGCGDFIDDYEGIGGYEKYREDIRLVYFASVEPDTGRLVRLRMVPMQALQMRLCHASSEDTEQVRILLNGISHRFGSQVQLIGGGVLELVRPQPSPSL